MKITLHAQTTVTPYNDDFERNVIERIKKQLTYPNPQYLEAINLGRYAGKIARNLTLYDETDDGLVIPRGFQINAVQCEILDRRTTHPVTIPSSIALRAYQERAIETVLKREQGVLVAPTGSGKTTMGIVLASQLGQRCLILVKSKDLAAQWIDAIKEFTGLDAGLIGGGKNTEGDQFTIGLTQTLSKRDLSGMSYGLVIADECHNLPAKQAFNTINQLPAKYRFGLSATPQRRDNLEFMIFAAVGEIVAEIDQNEVEGAVLPVEVRAIHRECRFSFDSWTSFLSGLAKDAERNELIVQLSVDLSDSVAVVVLTGTVGHAERLAEMFREEREEVLLIHGQLAKKEREQRMANAPKHRLIVGTLSLLSEGINWPHVGGVVFAVPVSASVDKETPAATRLIQSIGRARRPYPGKTKALVVDIVDRHPFGYSTFKKRCTIYFANDFELLNYEIRKHE